MIIYILIIILLLLINYNWSGEGLEVTVQVVPPDECEIGDQVNCNAHEGGEPANCQGNQCCPSNASGLIRPCPSATAKWVGEHHCNDRTQPFTCKSPDKITCESSFKDICDPLEPKDENWVFLKLICQRSF